ncbi:hypothetical protein P4B35_14105 [Pontiellaceae bacterium B12227]|nr:hypothetical protein [Pontiellaceae bacterium B12227]
MVRVVCLIGLGVQAVAWGAEFKIPADMGGADFAVEKIRAAAPASKLPNIGMRIDGALGEQAFSIQPGKDGLLICGGDERGLMYGGLELAERLSFGDDIAGVQLDQEPFIKRRGLKMNIPLDARCPSYDDSGTSARMNIEQVWSTDFWHGFLDRMAEHRFNTLTLWSNHPFTAMLKLEKYPEAAIEDVAVPTYQLDDHMLPQYMQAELQKPENYTIIKTMTMEEKVAFWQHVMAYAKDRGIDIYFITWNIWVHGAEGKHGITASQTNPVTADYMRESVKQFVLTYPDLKGLGITCGEHMQNKLEGENSVEKWMWKTYGQGIVDAKKEQPGREVHFIHRIWYSGMQVMMDDFISNYPDPIYLGFKYAKARLYSVNNPSFFKEQLQADCEKYNLTCWMNLRNDDIFNFRWGNPDYVRGYMKNLPDESLMAGYHMGSDGYVWGREFTSTEPDSPRQLEIDKHWYKFMQWGRLGYDPSLDRAFFEKHLALRFLVDGGADAVRPGAQRAPLQSSLLYETWRTASEIIPLINTWHWRDWDHMWSPETCMSKKEGYHSVDHFIEYWPLPGRGMQSIRDYVKAPESDGISPLEVADQLDALAEKTLEGIGVLRGGTGSTPSSGRKDSGKVELAPPSKELKQTLGDLKAFAHLGHYYADKIRGSTAVHQFRTSGEKKYKKQAVNTLKAAVEHWTAYGAVASSQYNVQLLARTSYTDWNGALLEHAEADIVLAQEAEEGAFPPSVHHKRIKELEAAVKQ